MRGRLRNRKVDRSRLPLPYVNMLGTSFIRQLSLSSDRQAPKICMDLFIGLLGQGQSKKKSHTMLHA